MLQSIILAVKALCLKTLEYFVFFIVAHGIIQEKKQQLTWRPESIHHKAQWSSMARGAHGGMISERLQLRKTGRVKTSLRFQRRGWLFSLFRVLARPCPISPPPEAGPLQLVQLPDSDCSTQISC